MPINGLLIVVGGLLALSGFISSPIALLVGIAIGLVFGNSYSNKTKPAATWLMAIAIVGLGAGIPLNDIIKVGAHGVFYTIAGIGFTFAVGLSLGKLFNISKDISCLVTAGTAICGGSAIAAISQVINARSEAIAISLGTVFLLNALALFVFPPVGHYLNLTQEQFGLWSGLAIHDTSSVIGAALQYGSEATEVATTTKLARAIWIIPLAFIIGMTWDREDHKIPVSKIVKRCWFIGGFLLMALLTNYVPLFNDIGPTIEDCAKRLMVLVLYLIGLGMTRELLRQVGVKPFLQGTVLWLTVSAATLGAVIARIIHL